MLDRGMIADKIHTQKGKQGVFCRSKWSVYSSVLMRDILDFDTLNQQSVNCV
jgi:hypothetical protein